MRSGVLERIPAAWTRAARRLAAVRLRPARCAPQLLLAAALALALLEPLVCIVHCTLWLPAMIAAGEVGGHALLHAGHQHHAARRVASTDTAGALRLVADSGAMCGLHFAGASDVPYHVPPSPVREVALALPLLLLVPPRVAALVAARLLTPPRVSLPPPLRPPALAR